MLKNSAARLLPIVSILFLPCAVLGNQPLVSEVHPTIEGTFLKSERLKTIPVDGKVHPAILGAVSQRQEAELAQDDTAMAGPLIQWDPRIRVDQDQNIQTYIHVTGSFGQDQMAEIKRYGAEIDLINESSTIIQARIPLDRVTAVSQLPSVTRITAPTYGFAQVGSVTTEGDSILRANELRALGFNGTGVRVGVISDGVDNRALAQSTGDLPGVQIVTFQGSGDEGTALLEIVHDLAPGATLGFCGLPTGTTLEFNRCVRDLTEVFEADIIVDDVGFLGEPYFQDGPVAQEVARAVRRGVVYVSSAGNSAERHYETRFTRTAGGPAFHDFGVVLGTAADTDMDVRVDPGGTLFVFLQWNDPFGGSGNDYDLGLFDEAGGVVAVSALLQNGDDDPLEVVGVRNVSSVPATAKVVVEKAFGDDRRIEMYLAGTGFDNPEYKIRAGSVSGHQAIPGVLAVGAINASDPGNDNIEPFSSWGPAQIFFPAPQTRSKPDLVAIDGVSVTGAGDFPSRFFGTSAASPHVAGVAALLKSALPNASAAHIATALKSTAVDLGALGTDRVFGAGRVDSAVAEAELAAPDIRANGSNGPLSITSGEILSVTIALGSGNRSTRDADWWLAADTPAGIFHFSVAANDWLPGLGVAYQGPVFNLPPIEALATSGLPTGTYRIYFGVDKQRNGLIDQPLFYDLVVVNVSP